MSKWSGTLRLRVAVIAEEQLRLDNTSRPPGASQPIADKIRALREEFQLVPKMDESRIALLKNRFETLVITAVGEEVAERFIEQSRTVEFRPRMLFDASLWDVTWPNGQRKMLAVIDSFLEYLEIVAAHRHDGSASVDSIERVRCFIVHGHDATMLNAVRSYIAYLGLDPIVLSEEPNQGMTIFQKFKSYAEVDVAIVLLSPDDIGRSANAPPSVERYRARQNVILELGYFMCQPGPQKTIALLNVSHGKDLEHPSDMAGILYVEYDEANAEWKRSLFKELSAAQVPLRRGRF